MRRVLFVLITLASSAVPVYAQSRLPAPEHALIIAVRSSRQATAQAQYELTLASGTRITVWPKDVHDAATVYVRGVLGGQAWQPVDAALLFVLHIQSFNLVGKSRVDVVLHSGALVRVAANDVGDPRLTFLRTALAEAVALERAERHRATRAILQNYVEMVSQRIRQNWQRSQGVDGKVMMKFVVHRDGRITGIEVTESGGELLDLASMRALLVTGQLPPFPPEVPDDIVTVHLVFEYQR